MEIEIVSETYQELGNWVANHIMRLDTQVYPCVKAEEESQAKNTTT